MKHLLIIDPADFIGGAELFTIDLLKKIDRTLFTVTVVTGTHEPYIQALKPLKVKIRHIEIPRLKPLSFGTFFRFFSTVRALRTIIREENPDFLQTNSIRAHICGSFAALLTRKKIFWILHDFTFSRFFFRLLIFVPQKIVIASQVVRDFYKNMIPKRYHKKFIIIPNGIDFENFQSVPIRKTFKHELNLGEGVRFVGIIGRIDWWKGHDHFLRACSKVLAQYPKTRFLIVGASSAHDPKTQAFERSLKELVCDLHMEREVYFLGFRKDVPAIIQQLSVLVHASTQNEPFGRVVLEAMALKTPVIASPFGGPKEIIEDEKNGLLVDPLDHEKLARSICRVLENEKLAHKLRTLGLKTVQKHYDLPKIVKRIEKLYEE